MTKCGKGESAPLKNAAGPLLAILILVLIILAYEMYVHRATIKFYYDFYSHRITQRERSFSKAFSIAGGLRGVTINTNSFDSADNTDIKAKEFTIDIGFKGLCLTLNSVSSLCCNSSPTGVETQWRF